MYLITILSDKKVTVKKALVYIIEFKNDFK